MNQGSSPRDSGATKRVAELNGKRFYFCEDSVMMVEEQEGYVCVLNFTEDDDDEEQGYICHFMRSNISATSSKKSTEGPFLKLTESVWQI
ncbi:hypothetical protein QL285_050885 [Trifolium repens]|nr:hypothetical protein QL285_050885 [Trifolium repens]